MHQQFSVLMSLYIKEKPEYFDQSINSVLANTIQPDEIVIVLDGPITEEMRIVLNKHVKKNPSLYRIVALEKNHGLGLALREGVVCCKNELIARMDTDDICRSDRFELQIKEFEKDSNLDICGSHIAEFDESPDKIIAKRVVPLDNKSIKRYQKKRDAFNHMTVMFKKSSVIKAGNYQSCYLMEDSLLWACMFCNGCVGKNINDYLVFARIGKDMYERRGGLSYFKKYKLGRKKIYKTGFISWFDYMSTLVVQFFVSLMPNRLRGFVFKKVLHKK